ncbi:uncharacterized protein LOC141708536 [Apium graveolens]|uniref:uncharacterized protein LOC141708536 n=1 Tax=Apium graveolens TaxID=4045 RepID=UPI003D7B6B7B
MNAIGWNCRGVGSPHTIRVLKKMVKSHKPDLLYLSETLAEENKIEALALTPGFVNFFSNYLDIIIKGNGGEWRLTCFYGFPEKERRQDSWDLLRTLATRNHLPWCVLGDFNDLMYASDKKGRRNHSQRMMDGFRKAVDDSSLIELNLQGGDYTWEKSKGTTKWVRERLDRCFTNGSWWSKFPLCTLTVFHTSVSDHDPIKLELLNTFISKKQFRFRFENTWLKESNFHKEVIGYWKKLPAVHLLPKLLAISSFMAK